MVKVKKAVADQYFVGILPTGEVLDDAWKYKNYFAEKYNSKASLNSSPHITLHMPFRWKTVKKDILINSLNKLARDHSAFELKTCDFSCFAPRSIFINIEETPRLIDLQSNLEKEFKQSLKLLNANYRGYAFKPHITLAFRDIRKPEFEKAWNEFKGLKYQKSFDASQLTLFKHDGKLWQEEYIFKLHQNKGDCL